MKIIISIALGLVIGMLFGRTVKDILTFDIKLFRKLKKECFISSPVGGIIFSILMHSSIIVAGGFIAYFFLNLTAYIITVILITIIPIYGTTPEQKLAMYLMKHMSTLNPDLTSIIQFNGIKIANPDEVYSALNEYIKE